MDWPLILISVGVAHAVLLALYAAVAAQRKSWHAWLATLFTLLAVAATSILITHRTEGWPESAAMIAEDAAAWFVGPVLFAFLRDATDRPLSSPVLLALFAAAGLVALAEVGALVIWAWTPPSWAVVGYLCVYSAGGAVTFARHRHAERAARTFWWPVAALAVMFSIHAGQIMRLAAPRAGPDAVPLTAAIGASLTLLALLLSQAGAAARGGPRYARSSLTRPELERINAALVRALDGPPPLYRRLDLSLSELSAAAGAPAHQASQALSEIGGVTFYELLTRRRTEEARRQLLDPANAHVAVEALGMQAGFRSRSSFYAAFKSATGLAPAEYRRRGGEIASATGG